MQSVVSNASPLILLSGLGELARLQELFGSVLITPQVYDEVVDLGKGRPGSSEVSSASFVQSRAVVSKERISEIQARVHIAAGGASTIILADGLKADVVLIDEKAARRSAREFRLKVAGTMRVLELAFERNVSSLESGVRAHRSGSYQCKCGPIWSAPLRILR